MTSGKQSPEAANHRSVDMDAVIGYILLSGVLASVVLVAAGLVWHWVVSGRLTYEYALRGMSLSRFLAYDIRQLLAGKWSPAFLIDLGIAVLMLTPFTRVAFSVVYFGVVDHNWKYTAFTGIVLAVLTYSLFIS